MAGIVLKGIIPELPILGTEQQLVYGAGVSPLPLGLLTLQNKFTPDVGLPSITGLNFRNEALSGIRLLHKTSDTDTYGSLVINRYLNNDPVGDDLMTFDASGNVSFFGGISFEDITISEDLNMNGHRITNLANSEDLTDAVNYQTLASYVGDVIGSLPTLITLDGAVTGSGNIGDTITTTLANITVSQISNYVSSTTAFRLDQFAVPTADVSMNSHKLTNGVTPTVGTDFVIKSYADSIAAAAAPIGAKYIVQTADATLTNEQALSSLATGIVKNTTTTGVLSIATPGTDYYAPGFFGPNVALPFVQLNYNWDNAVNFDPFVLNHSLTNTSSFIKQFISRIGSTKATGLGAGTRNWDWFYDLGDPTEPYGELRLEFSHPLATTMVPFKVITNPLLGTPTNIYLGGILNMSGNINMGLNKITSLANPFDDNDGVNKIFMNTTINNSDVNLTGSVTGTGKVNGSGGTAVITAFANSQAVNGTTQTFNYSNALTSSIFALVNTNSAAVTKFKAGSATDSLQTGYDGSNGYSFIDLVGSSNDRLAFRVNGTGVGSLLASGLFGLGTITPTQAKAVIVGGVQNLGGEESAIRAIGALTAIKIELQNTATNGKLWEFRAMDDGSCDITNRTNGLTLFKIYGNNIGMNMGGTLPVYHCDVNGTTRTKKLLGYLGAPTVALGAATGTGGVATITGNEIAGTISITTGTGATSGLIGTFTIAAMPSSTFSPMLGPNTNATAAANLGISFTSTSATTFTVTAANALASSTTYKWNYHITG